MKERARDEDKRNALCMRGDTVIYLIRNDHLWLWAPCCGGGEINAVWNSTINYKFRVQLKCGCNANQAQTKERYSILIWFRDINKGRWSNDISARVCFLAQLLLLLCVGDPHAYGLFSYRIGINLCISIQKKTRWRQREDKASCGKEMLSVGSFV